MAAFAHIAWHLCRHRAQLYRAVHAYGRPKPEGENPLWLRCVCRPVRGYAPAKSSKNGGEGHQEAQRRQHTPRRARRSSGRRPYSSMVTCAIACTTTEVRSSPPVLPLSGPTGLAQFSAFFRSISAGIAVSVTNTPSTNTRSHRPAMPPPPSRRHARLNLLVSWCGRLGKLCDCHIKYLFS